MARPRLSLPEELLLLALRNREGTVRAGRLLNFALAGAILSELLLAGRIRIEGKKDLVVPIAPQPVPAAASVEDGLLEECLERIASARKHASLRRWVARFARIRRLRDRLAHRLCRRGILRAEERRTLLFFRRRIYPEADPAPERALTRRLRGVVLHDSLAPDPRTALLVSFARDAGVLRSAFHRDELERRKTRIERIARGQAILRPPEEPRRPWRRAG